MKILFIKLSALGDVLASTPLFASTKAEHPDWFVSHVVARPYAAATRNNANLDDQFVVDSPLSQNFVGKIRVIAGIWRYVLRGRYDIAVVLHRSFVLQLICRLALAKKIIGYEGKFRFVLNHSIPFSMKGNRSELELRLLKSAGIIHDETKTLEFDIDFDNVDWARLQALPDAFVAVNPGGGNAHAYAANKMWPAENYGALIKRLRLPVVMLGHGEADERVRDRVAATGARFVDMIGTTNLDETAVILKRSRLYVGNDSALLYLAASLGVTTVGIYGPTDPAAFSPLGASNLCLSGKASCAPCYSSLDGLGGRMYTCMDNVCMKTVTVESVIERIHAALHQDQNLQVAGPDVVGTGQDRAASETGDRARARARTHHQTVGNGGLVVSVSGRPPTGGGVSGRED
ncbi:glycosyltransferase family 9 protein [Burkholderia oklahomensis]|uniref:glycosyltransferase family 9 protein n=1 Tax=Burkholderia oklahomensis TaxID=342113 RepID=UPI00264B0BFF|nr:glycosyltransferase family 9 protein [Burkholderia oklahomensis]MDN7671379.1 glycosyltransferase family 9 protein [Burkholderia oklahomensis]